MFGTNFAGQRLGGEERHEHPGGFGRLRVGRNAHLATTAHFLDDAENAFLGRSATRLPICTRCLRSRSSTAFSFGGR
jgi:hypothetical protein